MTYILEIAESAREKVLWMLDHFGSEVKIHEIDPVEECSAEETAELLELLNAIPAEEREIAPGRTIVGTL